jgi:hypothetical protein
LQAEELVGRKVSYKILDPSEAAGYLLRLKPSELLPLWNSEESKMILQSSASELD